MSRDYKSRKKVRSYSLIWGIFIGYVLGLISAMGIWLYLSQAPSPFLTKTDSVNTPLTRFDSSNEQKEPIVEAPADTVAEVPADTEAATTVNEKQSFDFYKILPGIEEPAIVEAPIVEAPIDEEADASYFLQAGSFRFMDEAENLKARLALLGMVAAIKSAEVSGQGTWYRVRIGPYSQFSEADQTHIALKNNGIEADLIKSK